MVKKIITGTRSGTEKAALAVAAKLGISDESPTGIAFDAADSDSNSVSYLDSRNFEFEKKRMDFGIAASTGTLIFSRGNLTRHGNYARKRTLNLRHQLLGIDLAQVSGFQASTLIASWIKLYHLTSLYITGPDADEDGAIYSETTTILESALLQARVADSKSGSVAARSIPPRSVNEAIAALASDLSFGDKTRIANMKKEQLGSLDFSLGNRIKSDFKLWSGNEALQESCRHISGDNYMGADEAVAFLIRKFWQHLQKADVLKIVKG